jgi:glycosyltransferase involved in cell wall biosynthesis
VVRVLHSIDTTGPGGAETVFVNLAVWLDPNKFESYAVIRGAGWVCDTLRSYGIEPIFVQSKGGVNFRYLRELVEVIHTKKIDVVQSHLLGSNLYCCLAGMICRVPVISTFHGFVDANDMERLMWLKRLLINLRSRKIVFVSDRLREHYVQHLGFSERKSVTIYNGVDTSIFYPQKNDSIRKGLGIGTKHVVIGAVGNIRPSKGYDLFLKAARLVYDQHPECRFVVAGQGAGPLYQKLLKLRDDLGLKDVFFFIGFRSDTDLVYNNFDLFVLPSTSEGFSISTIEAMACGLPVIVTRSGGPEEIVSENRVQGTVVECNEFDIANAMNRYLEEKGFLPKYDSFELVANKYSLSSMVERYTRLFNNKF